MHVLHWRSQIPWKMKLRKLMGLLHLKALLIAATVPASDPQKIYQLRGHLSIMRCLQAPALSLAIHYPQQPPSNVVCEHQGWRTNVGTVWHVGLLFTPETILPNMAGCHISVFSC